MEVKQITKITCRKIAVSFINVEAGGTYSNWCISKENFWSKWVTSICQAALSFMELVNVKYWITYTGL